MARRRVVVCAPTQVSHTSGSGIGRVLAAGHLPVARVRVLRGVAASGRPRARRSRAIRCRSPRRSAPSSAATSGLPKGPTFANNIPNFMAVPPAVLSAGCRRGRWRSFQHATPTCQAAPVKIGVLGATGPAGRGLAARLSDVGYDVLAGSRERQKAEAVVDELTAEWGDRVARITPANNQAACDADVVVLAVHADAALATAKYFADQLSGKIVVSMANHLVSTAPSSTRCCRRTVRSPRRCRRCCGAPRSCTAFHLVPAAEFANLDDKMESDVVALRRRRRRARTR